MYASELFACMEALASEVYGRALGIVLQEGAQLCGIGLHLVEAQRLEPEPFPRDPGPASCQNRVADRAGFLSPAKFALAAPSWSRQSRMSLVARSGSASVWCAASASAARRLAAEASGASSSRIAAIPA